MRSLVAAFAMTTFLTHAHAVTTKLEKTTVRTKPSATSSAAGVLPAGTEIKVVGQSGGYTQVKFQKGGKWETGYVATSQLNAGSGDVTKSIGSGSAQNTGYSKKDVAAAINMGAPIEAGRNMMNTASETTATTVAAADEMSDEFDSLPEDLTGTVGDTAAGVGDAATEMGTSAVNSATSAAAKKKSQVTKDAEAKKAQLEQATNAKKGELANATKGAEAKKMEMVNAGRKSVADKKAALDSQINAQTGAVEDQKAGLQDQLENNSVNKMASGAAASAAKAKGSVTAIGDLSGVEALESMQFSRGEFSSGSPFVSEGHLKSKTLK